MLLFPTPTLFTNVDYKCKELSLGYGGDAFLTCVVVIQFIYLVYTHTHIYVCMVSHFSCVQLFCDPLECSPTESSVHEDSPGQNTGVGDSLVVQWLRLHAPNAGDPGSIPCQGTRSLHATP